MKQRLLRSLAALRARTQSCPCPPVPRLFTLYTVQPELRSRARILKTLSVQGFLNHYFAALLKGFKIMLARQFLIGHSLYNAVNSQANVWNRAQKRKSYLTLCLHRFVPYETILGTWSQQRTRMRTFKTLRCSGTPCKMRNYWAVFSWDRTAPLGCENAVLLPDVE